MAGIDKTYTSSYKDYKEFKDWANDQFVTFFNGYKVCIGEWVWEYEKEDFDNGEIPIMNTPTWLDIYLIQNCKAKFVLDRMKAVYDEDSYKEFQTVDLTAKPPISFQQKRKIKIRRSNRTKYPVHPTPFGGKIMWWLQSNDHFEYDDDSKTWSSRDNYYPSNTNTSHVKTLKALVRHLRKQYLPKGAIFNLIGRYVGEDYLVVVS